MLLFINNRFNFTRERVLCVLEEKTFFSTLQKLVESRITFLLYNKYKLGGRGFPRGVFLLNQMGDEEKR